MSRIAAEPTSSRQAERRRRVLRAAAELGAEKGLERVQMQDVARYAEVAIGTLYRYFPSKTHLFTGVMAAQVRRLRETALELKAEGDPEEAVRRTLVRAGRNLFRRPLLASAMLHATSSAHIATNPEAREIDKVSMDLVLGILGIDEPTTRDVEIVRLLLQCWHGVLTAALNGRMSVPDAEADLRLSCRLLLAHRSNATAGDVAHSQSGRQHRERDADGGADEQPHGDNGADQLPYLSQEEGREHDQQNCRDGV